MVPLELIYVGMHTAKITESKAVIVASPQKPYCKMSQSKPKMLQEARPSLLSLLFITSSLDPIIPAARCLRRHTISFASTP
ncbi:hypothetical protein L596_000663 [Steinernema carpocapsae]|uniref:Uncharacterized protein n=1 Tax=Steinernema carpocapsae TaxID=34508 RepID=A0A4U8UMZ7_STECR|nr:hypothetical protein L596_000663 [Steinernema carpocapsae]